MLALKRRAAFGSTVGLALALHAAAAVGLAAVMSTRTAADFKASERPAMELRWISVVNPQRDAATIDTQAPAIAAVAALPAAPAHGVTPLSGAATQASPDLAAQALLAAAGQRGPEFLRSDEVDQPARPAQAWALDADGLAALGITRIVFDTWVDAQAAVAGLRVVAMEPASTASLLPLVEARLASTPMLAARKDGKPVAHQQRIDLAWQRAGGRPG